MQKVTDFQGVSIFVSEDGWFTCTDQDKALKDRTLEGIKKQITKSRDAIDAVEISLYSKFEPPQRVRIVSDQSKGRFRDADTGKLLGEFARFYYYDDEIIAGLNDLRKEYRELERRWDDLVAQLKRVSK